MGFSWQQLLILLLVVVVIFGTKKLRNIGSDLGGAVKDFKKAMNDDQPKDAEFKKIAEDAEQTQVENSKQKEQA
ncbi:Sec-independent protein translocase TatA [Canicola haemoglobinophilus]|uniref:Sec-independent protein translocase protein TatA n=1 Tax=Canicola haemoglobinophilus TaxID=733 RepID=A0A1V4AZY5_9PAST|nr:Sec-independent protein translocase subunit TatA [Canicola haemoglobinophilus]MBN6709921.1 Sec-independent protein translocase subunit TatA [Canicola haemoglobinophilus]OOR99102.1 Sec-independent protein translocase TatA [Canicola haemoglobinophilus]STO55670.1 Sec-independent protein translocase [Canicola haemoglobinophilus]STO58830.1 Sec-independent protein translocase [Canicola haemoglobinophilus]STO67996.1 Sec-independent protein translocase [Canicola haemoglobinophilus]